MSRCLVPQTYTSTLHFKIGKLLFWNKNNTSAVSYPSIARNLNIMIYYDGHNISFLMRPRSRFTM